MKFKILYFKESKNSLKGDENEDLEQDELTRADKRENTKFFKIN